MSILERVIDVVKQVVGGDIEVTPESRIIEDLFMDSLDLSELILELEEEFDIDIDESSLQSFNDMVRYLESN